MIGKQSKLVVETMLSCPRHRTSRSSVQCCLRLILVLAILLQMIQSANGLANPSKTQAKSSQSSPYYSYKTFKRMGVPAILYSAVAKAAGRLVRLKPIEIASSTTTTTTTTTTSEDRRRKVALVTGSNTGVGFATAKSLAHDHGFEVIIACRDKDKGIQACQAINSDLQAMTRTGGMAVFVQTLDLADLKSVRGFCERVQEQFADGIDVLVNNAGRNSAGPATTASIGEDEEEAVSLDVLFQTNFLGHFLLTNLLLDKCQRVVNLSSVMHHFPVYSKKDKLNDVALPEFWKQNALEPTEVDGTTVRKPYAPSKLASLLFSKELNRRYSKRKGIRSIAVNPGSV
jgi:NAD(P)-dependent dehydrogenase (short-subunit alcohol dehydrogenase family)